MPTINTTAYRSPNHEPRPDGAIISAIVVHSGEGTRKGDLQELCAPGKPKSAHYYVTRIGEIFQLVDETRRAYHAGVTAYLGLDDWNDFSIGIETEHVEGQNWPVAQIQALTWLLLDIIRRRPIVRGHVVKHAWIAQPLGRKSDPTNWTDADFLSWRDSLFSSATQQRPITVDSPLLAAPSVTALRCSQAILAAPHGEYSAYDVGQAIIPTYFTICGPVGIDPLLAIAQMVHETGNLTSYWAARPRRNPAGIGVTGEPGKGISFASWDDAIRAHVGRLLAYAITDAQASAAQRALINEALRVRPLPANYRGAARTLAGLTGRWATDAQYAAKLARRANAIRAVSVAKAAA